MRLNTVELVKLGQGTTRITNTQFDVAMDAKTRLASRSVTPHVAFSLSLRKNPRQAFSCSGRAELMTQ